MIRLTFDEADARQKFLAKKVTFRAVQSAEDKKREREVESRLTELERLIQSIYEDKVLGKVPEDVCIGLLEKYSAEKKSLLAEHEDMKQRLESQKQDERDVDEFIRRLKKYAGAEVLTRQMCLDLIGYITVDENHKNRTEPRKIHIYYKFLDKGLADKTNALA